MHYAPVFSVTLCRERSIPYDTRLLLTDPGTVAALFRGYLFGADREHFVMAMLDQKHRLIGLHDISIGTISASLVHPREVFCAAVLAKASALILGHNHPSGDPTPSPEDRELTLRLVQCGELMGIKILDHVILGEGTHYRSLRHDQLM